MKKIFAILFSVILLTSCGSLVNLNEGAKELQLDMTKEQAMYIMGKEYKVISVKNTSDGIETVLRFNNNTYYGYVLYFMNDRLVEWHEYTPPQPIHVIKEESNAN